MSQRISRYSYLLLLIFPLVLFSPTIFRGQALFWGTPLNQFVPWWTFSWENISQGSLPYWNDLLGMGAPLIANYQTALFYPLTWAYYLAYVMGGIGAMAWLLAVMVVVHLFIAGLGMAFLVGEFKLSRFAQIVAGLAFCLSGYLVARAGFLSINASVAWLPWIIWGATRMAAGNKGASKDSRNKLTTGFMLLVCAAALQLLAGHAQTAWYSLLLAAIWFTYLGWFQPWLETRKIHSRQVPSDFSNPAELTAESGKYGIDAPAFTQTLKVLAVFGSALLLAVGIAAVQLLPTAEYLLESQRSTMVDYDFAISYSFWPWRFLSFLAPGLFGNPALGDYWGYANYWEDAVYFGLIPFALVVLALTTWGRKQRRKTMINGKFLGFLVILIGVTFVIALGRNTPIFPWLYRNIPTFDMFQAPTRISILAIFGLTILSAVGADSWSRPRGRQLYWLRLGMMAAAAITLGAVLALFLSGSLSLGIRPSLIRGTAWLGFWALGLGFLSVYAPVPEESSKRNQPWGWWQWAVLMWIGLDLVVAGWGLNPSVEPGVYTDPSPTTTVVQQALAGGRIYLDGQDEEVLKFERFLRFDTFQPFEGGEDWRTLRASLLPNITLLDSLPSANNFDPMVPGRFSTWLDNLQQAEGEIRKQMLNLMAVTVVESIDLNTANGVRFDSRPAPSRFRWIDCPIYVADELEALNLITKTNVDLENQVILELDKPGVNQACRPQVQGEVQVLNDAPNNLVIRTESSTAGYLVIADVWYPGWRAFVDGGQVEIWHANYLFRAVHVPGGEHEVELSYRPTLFYAGALVSSLALLVLLLILAFRFRMRM